MSELADIANRIATPFPGPIEWDRIADAQAILAYEREHQKTERECIALHSALVEAIRRLKMATAGRPRRGTGYLDLVRVLDHPDLAPRPWEGPPARFCPNCGSNHLRELDRLKPPRTRCLNPACGISFDADKATPEPKSPPRRPRARMQTF